MGLVGRLEDLALPEIFSLLSLSRKTGKLVLRHKEETAAVIFSSGQVVQAATSSLRESIGHLLLLQKVITENELKAALEMQKHSPRKKRLGSVLLEKGFISQEVLESTIRGQIEEIIFEILNWKEGLFNFDLGETNIGDEIGVDTQEFLLRSGIKPEYLIMEGTRLFDEKSREAADLAAGVIPLVSRPELEALKESIKPTEAQAALPPEITAPQVKAPEPPPVETVELKALELPPEEAPELEEFSLKEEAYPSPAKVPSAPEITALRSMFMELRLRSLNGEITLLIMRYASETTDRGILFMVKGNNICGLGQFGMEAEGVSADHQVRSIRIPIKETSVFSWSMEWAQTYKGELPRSSWNDYLVRLIGGQYPKEILIIPMVVEKKVVALIYGDNLPTGRPIDNVESLEIFVNQAGMAMEKALLEHRIQELQKK